MPVCTSCVSPSPSSRGRGLKFSERGEHCSRRYVALFTRAWIEIPVPLLGLQRQQSPSSRGRGLKYIICCSGHGNSWSPSSRGRGLKSQLMPSNKLKIRSPSSRGRGLKYSLLWTYKSRVNSSPSSRGRGLKSACPLDNPMRYDVALFTRAWIEIRPL